MRIYGIFAGVFALVRQFLLPNPFDILAGGFPLMLGEMQIVLPSGVANFLFEPILHAVTFVVVGLYYDSGEPAVGSALYMFFYAVHVGLMYPILLAYPRGWLIALILVAYIAVHVFAMIRKGRIELGYM